MASQTLLNIDMLTNEALMRFDNALEMGSVADRQYEDYYAKSGAKIGDTLRVREPVRMVGKDGRALQVNTITEKSKNITVATQKHVAWPFNSSDMALTLDEYSERYIQPASAELASLVDLDGHALYTQVYNHVGLPGTDPATALVWLQAKAKLNQYSVPKNGQLVALMNESAEVSTVDGLKALFASQNKLNKQYEDGEMGPGVLGMDFRMTQNVPKFTTDTGVALGTLSATATSGTTIAVTGGTANGVVKAGTVFDVAGCYAFNLVTRVTSGKLQQFVVTADVTLSAGGAGNLTVLPELVTSGNYQNMTTAGAVSGQAATIRSGTTASTVYSQNWVMHKKSVALVSADLPMVSAPKISIKRGKNLSIRMIQVYDVNSDQEVFRMDILYGWAMMRPEWCCRVAGGA